MTKRQAIIRRQRVADRNLTHSDIPVGGAKQSLRLFHPEQAIFNFHVLLCYATRSKPARGLSFRRPLFPILSQKIFSTTRNDAQNLASQAFTTAAFHKHLHSQDDEQKGRVERGSHRRVR